MNTNANDLTIAPRVQTFDEYMPKPYTDNVGGGVVYTGWAPLGFKTSDAAWRILRQTTTGGVTVSEYADGNMNFEHIWDNRTTLKYGR